MGTLKKRAIKEISGAVGEGSARKGRPALAPKEQPDFEERDKIRSQRLQLKSLTDWVRKLDHMHTILTASDSNCKLFDYQPAQEFFLLLLLTYWVLTEIAVCVVGKKVDEFEENFEIVR